MVLLFKSFSQELVFVFVFGGGGKDLSGVVFLFLIRYDLFLSSFWFCFVCFVCLFFLFTGLLSKQAIIYIVVVYSCYGFHCHFLKTNFLFCCRAEISRLQRIVELKTKEMNRVKRLAKTILDQVRSYV